jgi:hypothetical protein
MQSIEDKHKCFHACFLLCLALPDIGSDERQHGGEIVCNNKVRKLNASAFRWAYTHVCNDKITLLRVMSMRCEFLPVHPQNIKLCQRLW